MDSRGSAWHPTAPLPAAALPAFPPSTNMPTVHGLPPIPVGWAGTAPVPIHGHAMTVGGPAPFGWPVLAPGTWQLQGPTNNQDPYASREQASSSGSHRLRNDDGLSASASRPDIVAPWRTPNTSSTSSSWLPLPTDQSTPAHDDADVKRVAAAERLTMNAGDCVVCLEHAATYVVVPCGHMCLCHDCTRKLSVCPICRLHAQLCMRVFASGVQSDSTETKPDGDSAGEIGGAGEMRDVIDKTAVGAPSVVHGIQNNGEILPVASSSNTDVAVARLVEMGFESDAAGLALRTSSGNLEVALENLLTGGLSAPISAAESARRRSRSRSSFGHRSRSCSGGRSPDRSRRRNDDGRRNRRRSRRNNRRSRANRRRNRSSDDETTSYERRRGTSQD